MKTSPRFSWLFCQIQTDLSDRSPHLPDLRGLREGLCRKSFHKPTLNKCISILLTKKEQEMWELWKTKEAHLILNIQEHLSSTSQEECCIFFHIPNSLQIVSTWWLSCKEFTSQCKRHGFNPWVGKIPWRKKWQYIPVFLPGKSHWQRSLGGYSPWGLKWVRHDLTTDNNNNTYL